MQSTRIIAGFFLRHPNGGNKPFEHMHGNESPGGGKSTRSATDTENGNRLREVLTSSREFRGGQEGGRRDGGEKSRRERERAILEHWKLFDRSGGADDGG